MSDFSHQVISPASFAQRSMWAFALRYRNANLNEMIIPWRIRGALRVDCLNGALSDLVARHPTLRARLRYEQGQLHQVVLPADPMQLPVLDLPGESVRTRLEGAAAFIHSCERPKLNIIDGPSMVAVLLRANADEHVLCLFIHHAMCDGASVGVILRDLFAFYRARLDKIPAELPLLTEQYADVARWEGETYASGGFADEIAFWKVQLADLPPPVELPTVGTRKGNRDWQAFSPSVIEPSAFMVSLRALARDLRVSPFAVMMATLGVVLRNRTGSEDLLVGVPTLNRWSAASMQFVGYATSLMPVRMRLSETLSFDVLCTQVHQTIRKMLAFGRVPLEVLMKETDLTKSGNTVFPVWAQFIDGGSEDRFQSCGLEITALPVERKSLLAELDVDMFGTDQSWRCEFAYRSSLFDATMIHAMMNDYLILLHHVQHAPRSKVHELDSRIE